MSEEDKFKTNEIVEKTYNSFKDKLEIIKGDVYTLVEDIIDDYYDEDNYEEVIPIIEQAIKVVSEDFAEYMSPGNKDHGIKYNSSREDKISKLKQRITNIINKANGIGIEESSDKESIKETCIDWTKSFYTIMEDINNYDSYDMREWLQTTKIFNENELVEMLN